MKGENPLMTWYDWIVTDEGQAALNAVILNWMALQPDPVAWIRAEESPDVVGVEFLTRELFPPEYRTKAFMTVPMAIETFRQAQKEPLAELDKIIADIPECPLCGSLLTVGWDAEQLLMCLTCPNCGVNYGEEGVNR